MASRLICALLFGVVAFGATHRAKADSIILLSAEYNGAFVPPTATFPRPETTIWTYNYTVPAGQVVTGATVQGFFGNSTCNTTAPVDLYLDGVRIAQCVAGAPCTGAGGATGPVPFSYSFSTFAVFTDGRAVLSIVQTGPGAVRLGQTSLTLQTSPVPEPATMFLLGTGLASAAAIMRRRRSRRRAS